MADGSRVVVLNDIHIGNSENTCWYQKSVHEPYLLAALELGRRKRRDARTQGGDPAR